jgi:tRNA pseudouridine55 synthase
MTSGFLLVDKAAGMTSHDVVAKARKKLGTKRVGHAGTLDPMATGVLVLGVGVATKLLQYVTDGTKRYEATIRLGQSTHTDDREGEVIASYDVSKISKEVILEELAKFVGKIQQRPSSVSAIKVDGKTAHERVRAGETVELPAREVEITKIEIKEIRNVDSFIDIEVFVTCSAGTYIRAIARDLGQSLNAGGHLTSLRRTLVSPFEISECLDLESAELISSAEGISRILTTRTLDFSELNEISFGRTISPNSSEAPTAGLNQQGEFSCLLLNQEIAGKILARPILVSMKE